MHKRWQSVALRVALFYAAGAGLWIGGSDALLGWLTGTPSQDTAGSMIKGFAFVAVTSALLFTTLQKLFRTEFQARAQAEETARQLQELEAIARHSGELLYKHSLDHRFTYVSPQRETMLGYSSEELGTDWTRQCLTDNPINQNATVLTRKAIETGERQPPYLIEVRKKNGQPLLLEIDESPLKDSQGKVLSIVGAARDVTKREKAQRALRQSEKRFRQMAETITDVFWMANVDLSRMHYVSPAYEQVWGRSCQSLYQNPHSWSDAIHPEDQPRVSALFDADRGSKELALEYRILRPDGSIRWILDRAFPLRDEAGGSVGLVGLAKDITDQKLAEAALHQSEENLRRLYSSMNEGMALHELVCDPSGKPIDYRILDVNPAFELITGFSRDQVVGALATVAYGAAEPPYLETYSTVAASGQSSMFETHFAPLDKDFAVSVFSPRPGQFATIFADISKRKDAERQICLLNQVYALVSHINEAIVRISDRDTLFRETCRILAEHGQFQMVWIGLADPSGQLQPVASAGLEDGYLAQYALPPAPTNGHRRPAEIALQDQRVVSIPDIARGPFAAPWRDAALACHFRSAIALPLKQGNHVIGVLCAYAPQPNFFSAIMTESLLEVTSDLSFALDLFERNHQRELEQQQLRLQHSALEAAANAIVITDRAGDILWVNDAFTRLTGYESAEAIGRNPRVLKSGLQDNAFYQRLWQTVLAGSVWQGGLSNKRKNGTLYDEEMTITPVRSQTGEITHFIAIKQDVTERKKLELQFLRAQRMQSIGLLAGGVAHDLNNVLAPVLMALPLLRTPLTPDQRDRILDTLEQSVKRGANIVQQVLTFARGVEVQRVPVQLRHLIREVSRIAEETFPRDIQIRADVPANLWPFLGDPTQIHQVLLNLAVNARDALPSGGQLSFTARNLLLREPRQFLDFELPPGRYTSVTVADTGTGIPPQILERIFEPFFTTKPVGKGTGLGLSTVLGIVKSHGGLVEVQSRANLGSAFTVFLPAAPADSAPNLPDSSASLPNGHGELILVVDDEPGILHITRSILEAHSYRVATAPDGSLALAQLADPSRPFKAVLTDIMMPYMDGLALTGSLRKLHPDLPVIVITGLMNPPSEEDRAQQLRNLGVKHFLRKPFEAEDLLTLLHQALQTPAKP